MKAVVFDLGNVMIRWDPRHCVREVLNDHDTEVFFRDICNEAWNVQQDNGRTFAEAIAEIELHHPRWVDAARNYWAKWSHSLVGDIPENVELMRLCQARGLKIYALSNWSAESFPIAYEKYSFLREMDGLLISGREKLIKPDPRFYQLIPERFGVDLGECAFIDDRIENCEAGRALGMTVFHYQGQDLRVEFAARNILS